MNSLLVLFILLALGCIAYSVWIYVRKRATHTFSDILGIQKEDDHLYLKYKGVSFIGDCLFDGIGHGSERRFVIKSVTIRLNGHPSQMTGWTKNDLYDMERQLLTQFPESNITWEEPMKTLITEE